MYMCFTWDRYGTFVHTHNIVLLSESNMWAVLWWFTRMLNAAKSTIDAYGNYCRLFVCIFVGFRWFFDGFSYLVHLRRPYMRTFIRGCLHFHLLLWYFSNSQIDNGLCCGMNRIFCHFCTYFTSKINLNHFTR